MKFAKSSNDGKLIPDDEFDKEFDDLFEKRIFTFLHEATHVFIQTKDELYLRFATMFMTKYEWYFTKYIGATNRRFYTNYPDKWKDKLKKYGVADKDLDYELKSILTKKKEHQVRSSCRPLGSIFL